MGAIKIEYITTAPDTTVASYCFPQTIPTGRAQIGSKRKYEMDAPNSPARRCVVTYSIEQFFMEPSYSDNSARYTALLTALKITEGTLKVTDENDNVIIQQVVRVEQNDLPKEWNQNLQEVTITFTGLEDLTASTPPPGATITPSGGTLINLGNVTGCKFSLKTDRYSTKVANRRETNASIAMTGKIRANPQLNWGQRLAYLQGIQTALLALNNGATGTLVYAALDQVVKVESSEADIKDGSDELVWSITCSYQKFPDGDYFLVEYEFEQTADHETHVMSTMVKGKIRAQDEAAAQTELDALSDSFVSSGRSLKKQESSAQRLTSDQDGDAFIELSFSLDYRENIDEDPSYTLSAVDKIDVKTGLIVSTWSGRVTAYDSATALATARSIAGSAYPIQVDSSETINTADIVDNGVYFVEVAFSYTYWRKGTWQYAEVKSEANVEVFGLGTTVVSGFATAATQGAALTLARSFQPGGSLLLMSSQEATESVSINTDGTDTNTIMQRVTFKYVYHLAAASGSMRYGIQTSKDYTTRETTVSYVGTAWASSESAADTLINALITSQSGALMKDDRTANYDQGSITAFMSKAFNISYIVPLAAGSNDVIEAHWSLETTYSVNQAILTPIPFDTAYVQTSTGVTIAKKVVNGTIVTIGSTTGQTWGRSLRTNATSGGYEEAPKEKLETEYYPMSDTSVRVYRFDFTYSAAFTDVMLS